MIRLNHIEKFYNKGGENEVHALKDVTLSIAKGEMIALMGISGSGKSTLLHILGLMNGYDGGEYLLDGQDVSTLSAKKLAMLRNKTVGFVMQSFGLIVHQTAYQNIALPLLLNNDVKVSDIRPRVMALLDEMGIRDKAEVTIDQLSGGQQQRVAIARAMANEPKLLIADEPTGALDSKTTKEVLDIFERLNKEKSIPVILATHDPKVAEVCSRTITVSDGMIS